MTALINRLKTSIQSEPMLPEAVVARMDKLEAERKRAEKAPTRAIFH